MIKYFIRKNKFSKIISFFVVFTILLSFSTLLSSVALADSGSTPTNIIDNDNVDLTVSSKIYTKTVNTSSFDNLKFSFNYDISTLDGSDKNIVLNYSAGDKNGTITLNGSSGDTMTTTDTGLITLDNISAQDGLVVKIGTPYDNDNFSSNDKITLSNIKLEGTLVSTVVNRPPVANNDTLTVTKNTVTNGSLLATDNDGDKLTYSIISGPTHGVVSISLDNNFTYTSEKDYIGSDSFTFKANDGKDDSNIATVGVEIKDSTEDEGSGEQTDPKPIETPQATTTSSSIVIGSRPVSFVVPVFTVGQVLGASTYNFTQFLKLGFQGPEVQELQKYLNAKGYDAGVADAIFGPITETAVKKFQLSNPPLVVDGIIGPITRAQLNK